MAVAPKFINEEFPSDVGKGARRQIQRNVITITNSYGFRQQSSNDPPGGLRMITFERRLMQQDQFGVIRDFYLASSQGAEAFLFEDWLDYFTVGNFLAIGDGSTTSFNLIKRYKKGSATVDRRIYYPKASNIQIFFDGVEQTSGFSWNATTFQIDFTVAPGNGVEITTNFQFKIPVVFNDSLTSLSDFSDRGGYDRIVLQEIMPNV